MGSIKLNTHIQWRVISVSKYIFSFINISAHASLLLTLAEITYISFALQLILWTPTSAASEREADKSKYLMQHKHPLWVIHTSDHSSGTSPRCQRDAELLLLTVFWGDVFVPRMVLEQRGWGNVQYAKSASKETAGFFSFEKDDSGVLASEHDVSDSRVSSGSFFSLPGCLLAKPNPPASNNHRNRPEWQHRRCRISGIVCGTTTWCVNTWIVHEWSGAGYSPRSSGVWWNNRQRRE